MIKSILEQPAVKIVTFYERITKTTMLLLFLNCFKMKFLRHLFATIINIYLQIYSQMLFVFTLKLSTIYVMKMYFVMTIFQTLLLRKKIPYSHEPKPMSKVCMKLKRTFQKVNPNLKKRSSKNLM